MASPCPGFSVDTEATKRKLGEQGTQGVLLKHDMAPFSVRLGSPGGEKCRIHIQVLTRFPSFLQRKVRKSCV